MVDLTIRGAGIAGLSVAWEAILRGARVRVVDPDGPGAGASGGIVGALSPHVPENWNAKKEMQLGSLLAAETFWSGVARASGQETGYLRGGRLQPLADDAAVALAEARKAGAARHWGDRAVWEVVPAPRDWGPVAPAGLVIRDSLSAHLHPRRAVAALAQAVGAAGGEIVAAAPEEGVTIWATGAAGLADLSRDLGEVGRGIKGQAALLDHDAAGAPQIFAGGVHVIPHLDGTVAVGSTTERDFDDPGATDAQLDDVVARARDAVPALREAPVIARWAGLRPRARSRAPMLGPWPGREGHLVCNGGFKIGFGMAPAMARLTVDLALEGRDGIPDAFRVAASVRRG